MRRIFALMPVIVLLLGFALSSGVYAEEKAEEGTEAAAAAPEFEYVQMDPLSLPIITTKGVTQQLSLMVSLEISYGEKGEITPFKPRLADAYIQDLYGALGAGHALMQGNIVNVAQIKQRLSDVTQKVLGPERKDKVHGVLLQVVQQRQL